MRILVTGGAGFIGSHLVDALIARGDGVRVLDNLEPQVHRGKKPDYLHPQAEYLFADILEPTVLPRALEGMEAVVHLAALVGVGQSMYQISRYLEINAGGTARLLEFLLHRHPKPLQRLVVASSMSIYGEGLSRCREHGNFTPPSRGHEQLARHAWEVLCPDCGKSSAPEPTPEEKLLSPTSVYAVSKQTQEELTLAVAGSCRIPAVALRFFNAYGPRQSLSNPYTGVCAIFSARLRNGNPPVVYEDGLQSRDFIHVSDIVRGILIALDHPQAPGRAFNVGTGRATTILQVAQTLARAYGVKVQPVVAGRFRAGDIRHCFADISRLARLGFRPRISLEEGLADLVKWGSTAEAEDLFETAEQQLTQHRLLE